jgi:hypothetical protein
MFRRAVAQGVSFTFMGGLLPDKPVVITPMYILTILRTRVCVILKFNLNNFH